VIRRLVETFRKHWVCRIRPAWMCLRGQAVMANWWYPNGLNRPPDVEPVKPDGRGLVVGNWSGPGFERGPDGKLRAKQ
jgi:hypothetical protein